MSTDKLDKLVMKTKTKVNWGKFKISRDKINFLNNQKEVQKRTLVKKFERNKTLNILDKNIMIPGIL